MLFESSGSGLPRRVLVKLGGDDGAQVELDPTTEVASTIGIGVDAFINAGVFEVLQVAGDLGTVEVTTPSSFDNAREVEVLASRRVGRSAHDGSVG